MANFKIFKVLIHKIYPAMKKCVFYAYFIFFFNLYYFLSHNLKTSFCMVHAKILKWLCGIEIKQNPLKYFRPVSTFIKFAKHCTPMAIHR